MVLTRPSSSRTPEQAAHQAGIEPEIFADFGHICAAHANRVQDACGPERPTPAKEGRVQRTDFHGDGASEATKASNTIIRHIV